MMRGLLFAAATTPFLSACGSSGFQPLYASGPDSVPLQLAKVDIAPIPGRVGQRVRNELVFQNTGGHEAPPPAFRLEVALRDTLHTTLVQSDGTSRGQIYLLEANFRLVDVKNPKRVLFEGTSYGRGAFERFDSIYSNVRAREDAENRVARNVAEDIKNRVAVYLSRSA
ncbi:MAG: LPS assembly lipoprotein LptE [Hyphomicrobiaceae bacterium]|nr:LPS assembly lipoprotein LptE [Hyphomicrobiaceae bacterium]